MRKRPAAGAAVALSLLAASAGCGGSGSGARHTSLVGRPNSATSAAAGCPAHPRLVAISRTAVAPGVGPLVAEGEVAWALSPQGGKIARIASGAVVTRSLGGTPVSLSLGAGRLWVAERDEARVVSLAPKSLRQLTSAGVPLPVKVLSGAVGVWALSLDTASLYQVDPASGTPVRRIDAPVADPVDMVAAEGELWVLGGGEEGLSPVSAALARGVRAGFASPGQAVGALSAADGTIWAADTTIRSLLRVRTSDVRVQRLAAPGSIVPSATAVGACGLWVGASSGELALVDPDTGRLLAGPVRIGRSLGALAASDGGVWASDPRAGSVVRVRLSS